MEFSEISGRVTRASDGYVLLKHYNPNSVPVNIEEDNTNYQFTTTSSFDGKIHQSDLSCCWIAPKDVDKLLHVLAAMCCGKRNPKFQLVNVMNASLWAFGERA